MNILDASRRQARSYPGGIDAVAPRLDKSPSTMEKELREARGYKWGAFDAAELSRMCSELRTVDALAYPTAVAASSRCLLLPLPDMPDLPLRECMMTLAATSRDAHDLVSKACESLADQQVSDNEMAMVDRAIGELVAAAQAMRRSFAALNRAGKPRGQR